MEAAPLEERISVIHPATGRIMHFTKEQYDRECDKAAAWRRALENAIVVPKFSTKEP